MKRLLFYQTPRPPPGPVKGSPILDLLKSGRYLPLEFQDDFKKKESLRQKGEEWLRQRQGKITSSKIANILGFFKIEGVLKVWYETYKPDQMPENLKDPEEEITQEKMSWGTDHEIDAVATLLSFFGETYNLTLEECILTKIVLPPELMAVVKDTVVNVLKRPWTEAEREIWENFLMSSRDGFVTSLVCAFWAAFEAKCKYGNRKPSVYSEEPYYYYAQQQAHILTDPRTSGCIFECWSPEVTSIWWTPPDMDFWKLALPILVEFHHSGLQGVPPTKLPASSLIAAIKRMCTNKGTLIAMVTPSVYSREREEELRASALEMLKQRNSQSQILAAA